MKLSTKAKKGTTPAPARSGVFPSHLYDASHATRVNRRRETSLQDCGRVWERAATMQGRGGVGTSAAPPRS